MLAFVWNLLSFVIALGILVTVHEYGHFWVARKNGVKVLRFSVGFGKALYSWHGKDGTEYVIGAIPLGGYVRMLDGRVDQVSDADKPFSFDQKRVTQRIAIVAAGPMANFVFAVVAAFVMYLVGVPTVKPIVGGVQEQSIAAKAGLQPLDQITHINGKEVLDWQEASYAFLQQTGSQSVAVSVLRDDIDFPLNFDTSSWQVKDGDLFSGLGFSQYRPSAKLTVAQVVKGSPAEAAGLQVGDKMLVLGEEPLKDWQHTTQIIGNSAQVSLPMLVERNGERVSLTVTPANRPTVDGFSQGYLGIAPEVESWPKDYVFTHQYAILPALQQAAVHTYDLIALSFHMIGKLVTGVIGLENLSGPIAIAQGAGISAQSGLVYFISFLALISVNLGVVNLLPLPVLDGGHLMYFFIELIRGKPVSERVQEIGFRIGAFALMMIMGIALINDFGRL